MHMGQFTPSCLQSPGHAGVPIVEHALWAEVGGALPSWPTGSLKSTPFIFTGVMRLSPLLGCRMCYPWRDSPVSMVVMHVPGNCRQKLRETKRFWGQVIWHLWIGRARNPGPLEHLALEVFNLGGWLTQCDLTVEAGVEQGWDC